MYGLSWRMFHVCLKRRYTILFMSVLYVRPLYQDDTVLQSSTHLLLFFPVVLSVTDSRVLKSPTTFV